MSLSRRKFVKAGVIAAAFAALPLRSVLGQSWKQNDGNPANTPPVQTDPLGTYSKATFKSYVNSIFQLHIVDGIVQVTLISVDDLPAAKGGECFSLFFRGGSRAQHQDTYTLVHPSLGTFQLLLVPTGSDQTGAQGYLATINRLSLVDAASIQPPSRQSRTLPAAPATNPAPSTQPAVTPATVTPATSPAVTPAQSPAPAAPAPKPGKHRGRKPQWKSDDNYSRVIEF